MILKSKLRLKDNVMELKDEKFHKMLKNRKVFSIGKKYESSQYDNPMDQYGLKIQIRIFF